MVRVRVDGADTDVGLRMLKELRAGKRERAWADIVKWLRGKNLAAGGVRKVLDVHWQRLGVLDAPARTTRQAVDAAGMEAWAKLHDWERDLWREYLKKYGHTADVTQANRMSITANTRMAMALRIMPRYVKRGARESFEALVNDPVFFHATVAGITAYFALWLAPEPIKAALYFPLLREWREVEV